MVKRRPNRIVLKFAALLFVIAIAAACALIRDFETTTPDVPRVNVQESADIVFSTDKFQPITNSKTQILRNIGYVSAFSNDLRVPIWVAYAVKYPFPYKTVKRPSKFTKDFRAVGSAEHRDYSNSGYDRGHMAPNYAIGRSYGETAQLQTFLMTNIVPQNPNMNRGVWCDIERYIVDKIAPKYGKVLVFVGPVFGKSSRFIKNSIAVPDACYAVVFARSAAGEYAAAGFLVPQSPDNKSIWKYCVPIDRIEAITGIDFLSQLPDETETKIEATVSPSSFLN